jgi:hypothetical protein
MYKIVYKENDTLVSPFAPLMWRVTYVPGEWTQATLGKIFVFDTIEHALAMFDADSCELWLVQTDEVVHVERIAADYGFYIKYWHQWEVPLFNAAPGTHTTSRIKLVERVL